MTRLSASLYLSACLAFAGPFAHAQAPPATITILDAGQPCSIRGMSVPDGRTVWVSGSNGHVARSTDTGKTWRWMTVPGYEKTDFRDIHAFDSAQAVIMGIGNPAYVLKTKDGGRTWQLTFTKEENGMFLDDLDFRNDREGICIGDPLDVAGKRVFFVMRTHDGGDTWQEERPDRLPAAAPGEAVFSASGTNIALLDRADFDYAFISGGLRSNLYFVSHTGGRNQAYPVPMQQGTETTGAFSMATDRRKKCYCAGGDYKAPDSVTGNFAWTTDGGRHWQTGARSSPKGYRSCIAIIKGERMVACGTNGVDVCRNAREWEKVSGEGFHVCRVSPGKKLVFFGGAQGKIGVLRL